MIDREFSNERGRVERRANFHKTRSRQQFADMFGAYLKWITHSGTNNNGYKYNARITTLLTNF